MPERARRRGFIAKYKLEVLAACEAAEPGEKGAILRRKGLCSEQELAKARFVAEVQAKLQARLSSPSARTLG